MDDCDELSSVSFTKKKNPPAEPAKKGINESINQSVATRCGA